MAQKTIIGTLKAASEEEKAGKTVVVYQVIRDRMKYPDYVTLWPAEDGTLTRPKVKLRLRYAWTCEAKPKAGDSKGEYLDFISVVEATAPPETGSGAQGGPSGEDGQSRCPQDDPILRRRSIERQTALNDATALAVALIHAGDVTLKAVHVVAAADHMAKWMAGEIEVDRAYIALLLGGSHQDAPGRAATSSGPTSRAQAPAPTAPTAPAPGGAKTAEPTEEDLAKLPAFKNTGEFMSWAAAQGYPAQRDVFDTLGCKTFGDIEKIGLRRAAWRLLKTLEGGGPAKAAA